MQCPKGQEIIHRLFNQILIEMNDEKFKSRIVEVVALLIKFRTLTDKSDRRILRDYIRAVVKELTLVE